jgi:pentatricopeptide repeat protein
VQLRRLVDSPVAGLADSEKLLGLLKPALAGLPDDQGAAAIYGMASAYARRGEWTAAREMFLLMVERYPTHARTIEGCRWLIRHGSSSEARRRHELGQFMMRGTVGVEGPRAQPKGEGIKPVDFRQFPGGAAAQEAPGREMPRAGDFPHLVKQQRFANMKDPESVRRSCLTTLELGDRLAAFGPLFASDPPTQFCLQAARRQLGQFKEAQEYYARFKLAHADGPWREAAASELWLLDHQGQPPRPVALCRRATTRPYLDGNLDDECWQGAQALTCRNAAEDTLKEYPTQAYFAYDREFLYLALRCKHPAGKQVAPVKARPRDADLRAFDRVGILLDLDRDYSTCFHLQVDQRGCVCEDCWGDTNWNPKWFVAVRSEADCWQLEAAIPLRELISDPVAAGTVWACNVVRILPGRGVQGWSLPAGVEPRPEGMGLLFFQQEQAPPRSMPRAP